MPFLTEQSLQWYLGRTSENKKTNKTKNSPWGHTYLKYPHNSTLLWGKKKICSHLGEIEHQLYAQSVFYSSQHHRMVWVGRELSYQLVPTPLPGVDRWFHWIRLPKAPFKLAATTAFPGSLFSCLTTQFHRDKPDNICKGVWTEKSKPNTICKERLQPFKPQYHE